MIRLSKIVKEGEEPKRFSNEVKKHFLEIVSTYNKYQEMMDRKSDITEVAETLGGITDAARELAVNEADDWFDAHTVKRNMNELTKLGKAFDQVAVEAKNLDQRLHGLYEDMGHILSRYYKIGEITEEQMKERLGIREVSPCWDGYKQVGMKMKGSNEVPNCVPTSEAVIKEEVKDWEVVYNVFVKFLKANTKELEKRVLSKNEDATKKAIKSIISGLTNAQRSLKLESVNEAKYPTDLKIGSVIMGQGFTRLKGVDGGKYYKVVAMDDTTATLVPSDKTGNQKGSSKVRHKLDSIEGGIKTAKRGDENGIVVIKESINEAIGNDKAMLALVDMLSNSMEHYASANEFVNITSKIPGFANNKAELKDVFAKYYKIGARERNDWNTKDWLKWLKQWPLEETINEKNPGLWANINAKKARGEKSSPKNSQAYKDAVEAGKKINKEAAYGYKDSTASYIDKHKEEFKAAEKMNKGNEQSFYDSLSALEEKIGHPKYMIFLSNALRGYKVDMYKDPKIKNQQEAEEALFLLSK